MSDLAGQNTQQLFKRWRSGDAEAGQAMAQRFSDWYYAISASRLGDTNCRSPLERACARFGQGVASVTDPYKLSDWAHGIIAEEIQTAGGRVTGGDHPNALTRERSPSQLLQAVSGGMNAEDASLLAKVYDPKSTEADVIAAAEARGGYPLAVLNARYDLKRRLRDEQGVGFSEVPDKPNLDWVTLPLYEGGRMASEAEEKAFELWMLSDLTLCKDIAEFAAFALALRGGAFAGGSTAPKKTNTVAPSNLGQPVAAATSGGDEPVEKSGRSKAPLIIGCFLLFVIGAVLSVVATLFLG